MCSLWPGDGGQVAQDRGSSQHRDGAAVGIQQARDLAGASRSASPTDSNQVESTESRCWSSNAPLSGSSEASVRRRSVNRSRYSAQVIWRSGGKWRPGPAPPADAPQGMPPLRRREHPDVDQTPPTATQRGIAVARGDHHPPTRGLRGRVAEHADGHVLRSGRSGPEAGRRRRGSCAANPDRPSHRRRRPRGPGAASSKTARLRQDLPTGRGREPSG